MWKVGGKYEESMWKVGRKYEESMWKVGGKYEESMWKVGITPASVSKSNGKLPCGASGSV